jgi:hypothetical protein
MHGPRGMRKGGPGMSNLVAIVLPLPRRSALAVREDSVGKGNWRRARILRRGRQMSLLPPMIVKIVPDIRPGEGMAQALTERYGDQIARIKCQESGHKGLRALPAIGAHGGIPSA